MWRSSRQAAECCELKAVVTLASVTFIGQNMSSCCKTHTHIFPHIQEKGKGRETLYFSSYEPTGWEILQLCGTTSPVLLAAACVIHGDATITSPATAHTTEQPPMVTIPEPWLPFVAQTPAKEKAKEGETVVLNCQFHSPRGPSLAKLMVKWIIWYRRIHWNNHWGGGSWYRRFGGSDYHFNSSAKKVFPVHRTRTSSSIV
ncbi:uncharacterized protein LOC106721978 isoform X11 [Alligator sinensis]|uniref:Uncharacterized protein LOC106721978 isoform X11 n=1 Tax=Alligator sinensis TaxID=38654 RepID=A0A3Q0G7N5_ALLSI|nr:uncharacterized protein LOC106721978 isoform X11 [Alligator sinensis]